MSITLFGEFLSSAGRERFDLDLGLYPDNSPVVDLQKAWDSASGQFQSILVRPSNMQEFFTAMMIVDSIRERGGKVESLILPCIPGQRQDRMKWEGDWLLTLKYVARTINSMNFKKVVSLDPHSVAAEVLIDRLFVPQMALPYLIENANDGDRPKYAGVIAPDAGAAKRAQVAAEQFGIHLYQASKHRDAGSNKLSRFMLSVPGNAHYLVVDDLCDAGGTFMGLAELIEDNGATADLFVTHGLFTKGTEQLSKAYKRLYTTDSTTNQFENVTYFKVVEGLKLYA